MCNQDLILEKIQNLSEKLDQSAHSTQRELDAMNSHLHTINGNISTLSNRVNTQNGRVSTLETAQSNCPGAALTEQFSTYKNEMKPVYILSTNYKMIVLMVVGAALSFRLIDLGIEWIINLLNFISL